MGSKAFQSASRASREPLTQHDLCLCDSAMPGDTPLRLGSCSSVPPPGSPMALSYPCQIPSPVIPWFKTFPFSPFMIRIVSSCPGSVTSEADCDTTALYLPFRLLSLSASRSVPFAIIIVSLRPHTFTAQLCLIHPFHPDPRPPFLFLSRCQILLPRILLKYKISHTLLYETAYNFKQNRSLTSLIQYTFQIPIFSTCLCFPRASGPRAKNKFAHLVKPSWAKGLLLKLLFFFRVYYAPGTEGFAYIFLISSQQRPTATSGRKRLLCCGLAPRVWISTWHLQVIKTLDWWS